MAELSSEERIVFIGAFQVCAADRRLAMMTDISIERRDIDQRPHFVVMAQFWSDPADPFTIDWSRPAKLVELCLDVDRARTVGRFFGQHYGVPLIDHTLTGAAA